MLEDVLGWAAVLVVSIVLLVKDIQVLDPLLSLGVTAIVLFNVIKNLKKTLTLFLQGVPDSVNIGVIEEEIQKMEMVIGIHHTHVWSLDGEQHVLTTHVVLGERSEKGADSGNKEQILQLSERHGLAHTTVEFEYLEDDCSMSNNHDAD